MLLFLERRRDPPPPAAEASMSPVGVAASAWMTDGAGPETSSVIRWYHPAAAGPDRPDRDQTRLGGSFIFVLVLKSACFVNFKLLLCF